MPIAFAEDYDPDLKWATPMTDGNQFCDATTFVSLSVLDTTDGADGSFVTFTASLTQAGKDAGFTERSKFYKVDGRWLYHSGEMQG